MCAACVKSEWRCRDQIEPADPVTSIWPHETHVLLITYPNTFPEEREIAPWTHGKSVPCIPSSPYRFLCYSTRSGLSELFISAFFLGTSFILEDEPPPSAVGHCLVKAVKLACGCVDVLNMC